MPYPVSMDELPEPGTSIKIFVKTWSGEDTHTGILLPSSDLDLLTIKLLNGYNISFPMTYISNFEIISEPLKNSPINNLKYDADKSLPLVYLIHTGGTIASKVDYKTGAVSASFEPIELINAMPELETIARIKVLKLGNMWSDDIRPRHWNMMLKATEKAFSEGASGVVITHGTDTLHLSAAAMAYGWGGEGCKPPGRIVLTGSQRSPDRGSSDASENIIASVMWAANGPKPSGYRDSSVIILHASSSDGNCVVLPGCASRKYHSSRRDSFKSINQKPIANIIIQKKEITIIVGDYEPLESRFETQNPKIFNENIRIAEFIAGPHIQSELIEAAIKLNFDALLLHGTGLGHLPISNPENDSIENIRLKSVIEDYCLDDGIVVIVAQTINGPINMNIYSKGRKQQEMGILGHDSLCPPGSALVKLHYLLSINGEKEYIAKKWSSDLVGENPKFVRE